MNKNSLTKSGTAQVVLAGQKPSDGYNVIVEGKIINEKPFISRIIANDYVDAIGLLNITRYVYQKAL